jgi:hypothetical protein
MACYQPHIKFYQFLSTTLSLQWVINKLYSEFTKEDYDSFENYAIFKIEVKIT